MGITLLIAQASPDLPGLKYDIAYLHYLMNDYSKSAELFTQIANEEPENVLAHYYAGITLYKTEKYELALIQTYLPEQLSRAEIEKFVREAVQEVGATTPKDMGKVMKVLMPRLQGQADGKLVNTIVKEVLS